MNRAFCFFGLLILAGMALLYRPFFLQVSANGSGTRRENRTNNSTGDHVAVRAVGRGQLLVNLNDGLDLPVAYTGTTQSQPELENNLSEPTGLASADFDEDGTLDLIAGYRRAAGGGAITLHRGNVDSLFPNSPEARQRRAAGQFTDAPFLPAAHVFDIPVAPDFLGAGDFDADGHSDVVMAARGGDALYFLLGDGHGGFGSLRRIELPGRITTMATGEINRPDGLADVIVGLVGTDGPKAMIFEGTQGALSARPEIVALSDEPIEMALGHLTDGHEMDLAIAAGRDLMIVRGRDRKTSLDDEERARVPPAQIESYANPFLIRSIQLGHFLPDGTNALQIALLGDSRFTAAFPTTLTPAQFVNQLFTDAGVTPSAADRQTAINEFGSATNTIDSAARARALRDVAENALFNQQEFNRAFVLMQYFGYLRRNPNDPQDNDYTGYEFWLNKLNLFNGNYNQAEMVKAFITSIEYRQRFGP
jgi:hypothetical protein